MTLQQIRSDLKEIRYYYAHKDTFERMKTVAESCVVKISQRYNDAIKSAPVILYDLYMTIYVLNNTQESVADDWDKSFSYVRKLHDKLLQYFQSQLTDKEVHQ